VTAREVLAEVILAGGTIIKDPERPRLMVRADLKPLVLEHREALKALLQAPSDPRPAPNLIARAYAHPWPDELPGFGRRTVGPLDPCVACSVGSWVRHGSTVLCLHCVRRLPGVPRL